jgi:hypothetical protein
VFVRVVDCDPELRGVGPHGAPYDVGALEPFELLKSLEHREIVGRELNADGGQVDHTDGKQGITLFSMGQHDFRSLLASAS